MDWINVKDRLPEEDGAICLVLFGRIQQTLMPMVAAYRAPMTHGKTHTIGGWITIENHNELWPAPGDSIGVEFWQPLTPPPGFTLEFES